MVLIQIHKDFQILKTEPSQWLAIKGRILELENAIFEEPLRFTEKEFGSFIKHDALNYILSDKDSIIGYLMACHIEDDEAYSDDTHFGLRDTLHLESIGILPKYQGSGLGQVLLSRFLDDARSSGYARVVMDATSDAMVFIGLKHGFAKVEFYPEWKGDRSSWYMEKIL